MLCLGDCGTYSVGGSRLETIKLLVSFTLWHRKGVAQRLGRSCASATVSLTSHALFQRLRRSDRFSDLAAHTLQRLLRSTIPSTVRFPQPLHTRASGRVAIRVIAAMVRRGVRIAIIAAMGIPPTATHGGAAAYATQMMELDWVRRHEWWRGTLRLCVGPTIAVFKCY